MKFVGYYGCVEEHNEIALEAKSVESANNYVYECACESYNGHYHNDYVDEEEEEYYADENRENEIEYYVEPFDYKNENHLTILKEQEYEFWEV